MAGIYWITRRRERMMSQAAFQKAQDAALRQAQDAASVTVEKED
jgi:hypothetical protein